MSLELLGKINDNYHTAVAVHREIADVCGFIGLKGYKLWHEYQHLDEMLMQRRIKDYITVTYHTFMPDKLPKSANIAEPLLTGKNRKALKMEDSYKTIKEIFRIYQEWEESSLKLYQGIAKEILDNGETSTFNFVSEIIKDVKAELVYATDKAIELSAMDWDMPQIIAEQSEYYERYEYLIKTMLGKSEQFHHWNGAYDTQSRMIFETPPGK